MLRVSELHYMWEPNGVTLYLHSGGRLQGDPLHFIMWLITQVISDGITQSTDKEILTRADV